MSDIALYRKYRPKDFNDVLGQDHIVKVLKGSINLGNISHAYLFSGGRGTGKTSIARIFSNELGCSESDIYEIDAASNRGIDDVREIRDSVSTLPFDSDYKVYIIDEVHMLTKEAFNALLKTLEEPPAHAVFILATTELHKVPDTVISRCQTFEFKKPTQNILKDMISSVSKKEGFKLEPSSADLIALLGDGSFRDSLGILQKIISYSEDKVISTEEVEIVTGAPENSLVNNFILSIYQKDLEKGLESISKATRSNIDIKLFIKLILKKLRFILVMKFSKDINNMIQKETSEEDFKFIKDLSEKKDLNINSQTILRVIEAYENTDRSSIPELTLELALIDIIGQNKG